MHNTNAPQHDNDEQAATQPDGSIAFPTARLTENLARIWTREEHDPGIRPRPGAAAQVAVVDEFLRTPSAGRLLARFELRLLLFGYCRHPDYDQRWADLLQDEPVSRPRRQVDAADGGVPILSRTRP